MNTTNHRFEDIETARTYTLAGNATITLQSLKTGAHYTYRIKAVKDESRKGQFFVSLLTNGSADEGQFTYLGMIRDEIFALTKASQLPVTASPVAAFLYFWRSQSMPEALVVRHEGKCGRCGRTLTVPESIDAGIGPECASKMAHAH